MSIFTLIFTSSNCANKTNEHNLILFQFRYRIFFYQQNWEIRIVRLQYTHNIYIIYFFDFISSHNLALRLVMGRCHLDNIFIVVITIYIDHINKFTNFRLIAALEHFLSGINNESYQFAKITFDLQKLRVFRMLICACVIATPIFRL